MKPILLRIVLILMAATTLARAETPPAEPPQPALVVREIRYDGRLSETEARFIIDVEVENPFAEEAGLDLFTGEIAVLPPARLPAGLQLVRDGNRYRLLAARTGRYAARLELVARIKRVEPWNEIRFDGPLAPINQLTARAVGGDVELQLRQGTTLATEQGADAAVLKGVLGAERTVALRWRSQAAEAARRALVTCATSAEVQVAPTVIKLSTRFAYEILQGAVGELRIELPADQALTRVVGEHIRDWQIREADGTRVLRVEFIKPVEKSYLLTLLTEQTIDTTPFEPRLTLPRPQEVERESGSLEISAEDVLIEAEQLDGLRRVNAAAGRWAAFQFFGRPFQLALRIERVQPVIQVTARVTATLEESRLLVAHAFELNVERAGIYAVTLAPLGEFTVAEVIGEGIEDWSTNGDQLLIHFSRRVLGRRPVDVRLERALKDVPESLTVEPLRVAGAEREAAQIGIVPSAGLRVRTRELAGAREIPVDQLPGHRQELLAFAALRGDWQLTLSAERMESRVVADVFNLVTIGDGLVGGSATIRYAILNQGLRAFRVRVPAHWRNIEFTGPQIRRKEREGDDWVISLQEKAWGGYTLVVTYDFQFDPHDATLLIGGVRALDAERETGSLAVMSAASVQIEAARADAPAAATVASGVSLYRIDETELAGSDRALATRPVLLAYRYSGEAGQVQLRVTRFEQAPVLQAVADRTQLTTVLTDTGQLLTQASFMVKNNDKQFQRFQLPDGAEFWGCYVDGVGVKAERDGDAVLVPLRRAVNRDQAFAVEIVYAEKVGSLKAAWPRALRLAAPATDVHTTYAEWELYVPVTHELNRFGGNMIVARGTTYGLRDAWRQCLRFYDNIWRETRALVVIALALAGFVALLVFAVRQRWRWVMGLMAVGFVLLVVGSLLLPALNQAREKARQANASSNLRQIGLSLALFADMNEQQLPHDLDQLLGTVSSSDKILVDPASGQRFVYVGQGQKWQENPAAVLAYSPTDAGGARCVLFGDGRVEVMSGDRFQSLGLIAGTAVPTEPVPMAEANGPTIASPAVAGIRPIRIDVPKVGTRYTFTKVLNVTREPLGIQASAIRSTVRSGLQGAAALVSFLIGLALIAGQLRKPQFNVSLMTLGVALVLGSLVGVLIVARLLGMALIVLPPLLAAVVIVMLGRAWWRRRPAAQPQIPPAAPTTDHDAPGVPPVVAAVAFLLIASQAAFAEPVAIQSATYTGIVREKVAEVEGEFVFVADTVPPEGVLVPLFGDDVAVMRIESLGGGWFSGPEAVLVRQEKGVAVRLRRAGMTTVRLKFLVTPGGDVAKRQLAFAIPSALASRVNLMIAEAEASVEVPTAVSFHTVSDNGQTQVQAVLGAARQLELLWTPRVKKSSEIAATVFAQQHALVTVGVGVINTRTWLDYQVTQGELRELRVEIPANCRVLRVDGPGIRTWNLEHAAATTVLSVELIKGTTPSYRLVLETERAIEPAAGQPRLLTITLPHALEVRRETGMVALRGADELALTVRAEGLQQADVDEFIKAAAAPLSAAELTVAYRFFKPGFRFTVSAEALQPQVEAVVRNQLRIGRQQISLVADVEYTIKKAGIFAVELGLPDDYRLSGVTGPQVAQWVEKTDAQGRRVVVTFKQRLSGTTPLRVHCQRWFKEPVETVGAVGVHPLHLQKLTGFVTVASDLGVQVKTRDFDGLVEVPITAVGGGVAGQLAFKFIQTEPALQAAWSLTLASELVPSWIRAEAVHWLTINPAEMGLVRGRSLVRYDIQNAPTSVLRLRIPAAFKNVEITGDRIRQRDQDGQEWRVELQGPQAGSYQLTITWEMPLELALDRTATVVAQGVQALDVERETGMIAIVAPAPLQVTETTISADLLAADDRELPDWAGGTGDVAALTYRYLRPGYELHLQLRRFEEAAVLQALIDNARLTSVVSEDGQMMTELRFEIRNNGRQYLELTLPPGCEVWSAFVAGQAVRPSKRDGNVLLPLERSGPSGAPVSVELTYVGAVSFPARRGAVQLLSPAVDVPLKNVRWELFLPPDYDYGDFGGSMSHEEERQVTTRMHSFSLGDYLRSEDRKVAALRYEYAQSLDLAEKELSRGNVKSANELFNRAARHKQQGRAVLEADEEVAGKARNVEQTLLKAQAENLITGQELTVSNYAAQAGDAVQPSAPARQRDEQAAETQWKKLQQAQEMTEVKISPLRVNLPSRGLRYSFSQTLQTEIGQAMTITLVAANTSRVGVVSATGMTLVLLGALWAIVAWWNARRSVA